MRGFVVDASVAVKWLVDEPHSDEAAKLLEEGVRHVRSRRLVDGVRHAPGDETFRLAEVHARALAMSAEHQLDFLANHGTDMCTDTLER